MQSIARGPSSAEHTVIPEPGSRWVGRAMLSMSLPNFHCFSQLLLCRYPLRQGSIYPWSSFSSLFTLPGNLVHSMISFSNTLKTMFISFCQFNQMWLSISARWKTRYLRSSVSYSYMNYKQIQCSLINATGPTVGSAFALYPEDREEIHHGNNSRG